MTQIINEFPSVDTVKGGAHVKKEEVEITVNSRNRFLNEILTAKIFSVVLLPV